MMSHILPAKTDNEFRGKTPKKQKDPEKPGGE